MSKNSRLLSGLMLLPVVIWVFVILYYSVNLPWYDDFDPFPDFLNKWIAGSGVGDRLTLLFQPNNEHRMVIGKLVTLVYYWVTGHLNFTFLHIAGACFTLGTLALFWKYFKRSSLKWWYFLPIPFLLFQLQYHLVFLWAICSLQHQPVVFFVCLSMYLLADNRFTPGILAALCATYAMSNGIFVWPAGVVILLLSSRYKELGVWILAGAIAIGFYFHGMSAQGNESSFTFFAKYPHLSVLGFFAFLGGLFDFFPEKAIVVRSALPVLIGFVVMIWIVIWLYRQLMIWLRKTFNWTGKTPDSLIKEARLSLDNMPFQMFLLGILTFLLVNALIIGLLRPRFGFFVMIVSNYKMYPALFLSVAYLTFLTSARNEIIKKRSFQFATVAAILIWVISAYSYLPVIAERQKYLTVNGYNQEHNSYGLGHVPFSAGAKYVDTLMNTMVRQGTFVYPDELNTLGYDAFAVSNPIAPNREITFEVRQDEFYVSDPQIGRSLNRNEGQYVFVRNRERIYLFKMEPHKYMGRNIFRQYDKGSDVIVPFTSLLPGSYDIGILNTFGQGANGGILGKIKIP